MPQQTLTVLFTDIVGSTSLLSRLGPRPGGRLMSGHFAVLRHQVARHRGREIKCLGDGLMAVFAAARDGIDCATAIQRASARQTAEPCGQGALSIRIGVSSGDVRFDDGDCFGEAVVEASRLCAVASGGQVLITESTRLAAGGTAQLSALGEIELKGLPEATRVWVAEWSVETSERVSAVLADDTLLIREGIAHVLELAGIEVTGQAGDSAELLRLTTELRPDVAIVDVRMPPTHTDEGLRAAEVILARHPQTGVLLLSQDAEPRYAERLRASRSTGVGYLLKEQVADVAEFAAAARSVANGGCVFDASLMPPAGACR